MYRSIQLPALALRFAVLVGVMSIALSLDAGAASATAWIVALTAGSHGEAKAQAVPSAPTGVTSACTASNLKTVKVTWTAVTHGTSSTIYQSTTSSSSGFSSVATGVVGTSWTSASLANGNYWYRVVGFVGTTWASAQSSSTAQRTIASILPNCV